MGRCLRGSRRSTALVKAPTQELGERLMVQSEEEP